MSIVIDCDQHVYETSDLWVKYCDPADRHLALTMEPDDLGYWWIVSKELERRLYQASITIPGDDFLSMRKPILDRQKGIRSDTDFRRDLPAEYWESSARCTKLDQWGIDQALLIPNFGLVWGRGVSSRPDILRVNMAAWNRRAVEIQQEGAGRLWAVGHVSLRGGDLGWLEHQLAALASGGVRFAMMSYGLADNRALSHPDHDRAWASFVYHGITPVFHIQDNEVRPSALPDAWFAGDHEQYPILEMPFAYLGIEVAIADLTLNGVFERHPGLRIVVAEQSCRWLPDLLNRMDWGVKAQMKTLGFQTRPLKVEPRQYVVDRVRFTLDWREDNPKVLTDKFGDLFMFGSDYPHCEGLASPLAEFKAAVEPIEGSHGEKFYGGTAATMFLN